MNHENPHLMGLFGQVISPHGDPVDRNLACFSDALLVLHCRQSLCIVVPVWRRISDSQAEH
jgi:hypothetical protein